MQRRSPHAIHHGRCHPCATTSYARTSRIFRSTRTCASARASAARPHECRVSASIERRVRCARGQRRRRGHSVTHLPDAAPRAARGRPAPGTPARRPALTAPKTARRAPPPQASCASARARTKRRSRPLLLETPRRSLRPPASAPCAVLPDGSPARFRHVCAQQGDDFCTPCRLREIAVLALQRQRVVPHCAHAPRRVRAHARAATHEPSDARLPHRRAARVLGPCRHCAADAAGGGGCSHRW